LSDYQGNNRVLFKDVDGTAEIVEDYGGYYPFGAIHQQQSDYQNKYLNEGKELQTELSLEWSDYHLRCKDNWMGRFTGIDVLADSYSNSSPYSYGLGNSISNGDPTGASVEKFTGDEAQQVFSGVQNSYNNAVASGENVNKNLWSSSNSSVGLSSGSNNSLGQQFPNLFGEGYTGLNNTEEYCSDLAVYGARGIISGISADAAIPDPTDGAWPKWAVYAVGGVIATGILYYADDGADAVPINIPISKVQDNNKDPHYVYEIKGFSTPNEGVVTMKYGIGRINGSNFRPQTSLAEVQKRFPKYLLSWNIQMVTADKPSAIMGEKYLNGYHFTLYGSLPKASTYPGEKKSKKVFNQFKR